MIWKDLPEFPYKVSEFGDVYSYNTNRILKPGTCSGGYYVYKLHRNGVYYLRKAHRLVASLFIGTPPAGKPLVLHNDGNPQNNHFTNLRWGDWTDNNEDTKRHGTHEFYGSPACSKGHLYTDENTYVLRDTRYCRTCKRERARKRKSQGLDPDDPRHGTNNAYVNFGCRCAACASAARNKRRENK